MLSPAGRLYTFLGIHSFLIGLFPFYIPVYLYTHGSSLAAISLFIAVTGLGFCFTLYLWDRISRKLSWHYLIVFSFVSECLLLSLFFLDNNPVFLITAGIFNGIFNCNFWIVQRLLFLTTITSENSGRKFGNYQLFVMVVLKIGIFIGGALLEATGFLMLYFFSVVTVIIASCYFLKKREDLTFTPEGREISPLGISRVAGYQDRFRSLPVFMVDGIFLYLESYFWVVSLFLVVHQSFLRLGLLVIFLTLLFGILFVILKNSIDRLPRNVMYGAAVLLYFLSWVLRGYLSPELDYFLLLIVLALITFSTSIFRLAFNKRFFEIAKSNSAYQYILVKSYFSQLFLALFFGFLGLYLFFADGREIEQLSSLYFFAALSSLVYFVYRPSQGGNSSNKSVKQIEKN